MYRIGKARRITVQWNCLAGKVFARFVRQGTGMDSHTKLRKEFSSEAVMVSERRAMEGRCKASHTDSIRRVRSEVGQFNSMMAPEVIGWARYRVESTGLTHCASLRCAVVCPSRGNVSHGEESSGKAGYGIDVTGLEKSPAVILLEAL